MSNSSLFRSLRFSAALLLLASACGEDDSSSPTGDDDDDTEETDTKDSGSNAKDASSNTKDAASNSKDAGTGKEDASSSTGDETKLSEVYTTVFKEYTCTTCHPALAKDYPIDLSTEAKAATTLLATKVICNDKPYVTPGDSDKSFLIDVMTMEDPGCDIPRMPEGMDPVSDDDIALVKKWIDDGAKK